MKNYKIVVARYNENVEWVKKYYKNYIIYNKGNNISDSYVSLENVGRESHTYLYHIVKNYDDLSDYVIFVQGNPFEHSPNFFDTIDRVLSENFEKEFCWICEKMNQSDFAFKAESYMIYDKPHINFAYEFVFGNRKKPESFFYGEGAQFLVSKERILSNPLSFYQKIFDLLDKKPKNNHSDVYRKLLRHPHHISKKLYIIDRKNPELGHHLERFWGIMFGET